MIHDDIRKLSENIVIHPVMNIPRLFRRVQIKPAPAKIVTVGIRDIITPGTGIRDNNDDVMPGCIMLHT